MLYPFLVFGLSGQIAGEESFLVKKPPNEKRHHYSERDKPQYEPSASGVPKRYKESLAYIGWRTIAYGPVEITF
jgi:hypothetical protein